MSIMTERDRAAVRTEFEKLTGPVKLVVFSQELVAGDLCRQNEQLVRDVATLSDKLTVEVLNPAIAVGGARAYGIRFYGIPSGYEFSNLIDSIIVASTGEPALSEETKASLQALAEDVDIKVFSTPT